MLHDETESIRRTLVAEINAEPGEREALEATHGQCWNTEELCRDFTVEGFLAPLVIVRRRADGARGSLFFQHAPRYYFGFSPDEATR